MDSKSIEDKNTWENFLAECEEKTFLQSWEWGEFQKSMGGKVWRMGVYESGELLGVALVVRVRARRGTFLLVQHGPVLAERAHPQQISNSKFQTLKLFLEELKKLGKQERASLIRMAPLWERTGENERMLREQGFRQAPMHANAYEATWKLDLQPPEEELLKNMRKTTRYLIRQALENKDIKIEQSTRREDLDIFAAIQKEVSARQQFVPFSKKYTESEFDVFSKDDAALLFLGTYKGQAVAAALVIFWSGVGFYHQAGSLGEYAKLSIPYLVQWEAIKEAKRRGCKLYDFWGYVDPKEHPKHPWAGPTLFKMGFGGKAYEYVKTQDYPLLWKYWPTAMFEIMRKKWRHL